MSKHWIQSAIKHPGALHKALGVKAGKRIPMEMLAEHLHDKGTMGRRARLAMTLRKMHH